MGSIGITCQMKWEKFTTDFITKKNYGNYLQNGPRSNLKGNLMKNYVILYKIKKKNLNGKNIKKKRKHALSRVPLDASRWTPKGETNGLSTLYVQKEYKFYVEDIVSIVGGEKKFRSSKTNL